jgi:hypothetical protein
VSCNLSHSFRGLVPGERNEMKAARMTTCPKCHQFVDSVSMHQLFVLDLIVIRCSDCGLRSVAGTERWIQYPIPGVDEARWDEVRVKADKEMDGLVKEMMERRTNEAEPLIGIGPYSMGPTKEIDLATAPIEDLVRETEKLIVEMRAFDEQKPETWHDREPLF